MCTDLLCRCNLFIGGSRGKFAVFRVPWMHFVRAFLSLWLSLSNLVVDGGYSRAVWLEMSRMVLASLDAGISQGSASRMRAVFPSFSEATGLMFDTFVDEELSHIFHHAIIQGGSLSVELIVCLQAMRVTTMKLVTTGTFELVPEFGWSLASNGA